MGLVPLSFVAPWALLALAGLPVIWWLLRVTPPAPARILFPAIQLMRGVESEEESPAHTPWWVLALRLAIAALLILALSGPSWNSSRAVSGSGPLVLVIDNTWAAAPTWEMRARSIRSLIDEAGDANRPIVLLPTAPSLPEPTFSLLRATEARELAASYSPSAFLADFNLAQTHLSELEELIGNQSAELVWLADGLEVDGREAFATHLATMGPLVIINDADALPVVTLLPPNADRSGFLMTLRRVVGDAGSAPLQQGYLRAVGVGGRTLATTSFEFEEGQAETSTLIELPLELRNEATRIEVDGANSAGAVVLVDEGSRRRAVGLVSGESAYDDQPLLSELFYLQRALEPYAEIREGPIATLLESGITVLILADVGLLSGEDYELVRDWLESGGVMVRFAGPRVAAQSDDLLPVRLRLGDRALGGALAWDTPQGLLPFHAESPFAGLDVSEEVRVTQQVLAEPEIELGEKTWARLADGTPLVTGARREQGWSVLFHVTANQDWSTLPASGLYVEMLRRLVRLSNNMTSAASLAGGQTLLPPLAVLDGYGRMQTPPPTAEPITASGLLDATPSPKHPPGLYGADEAAHALNAYQADMTLTPASNWPTSAIVRDFREDGRFSFKPTLLVLSLLLFLADMVLALYFAGHLRIGFLMRRLATPAIAGLFVLGAMSSDATAQDYLDADDLWALDAANDLHLAYIITGDAASDDMSRAGLEGLTRTLYARTSVEPADPIGVDLETQELAFFPLLYWRISPDQEDLSPAALERLTNYMRNGGTVLIDTADEGSSSALGRGGAGSRAMRRLIRDLDVPSLAPVPDQHVLTRAFYLINTFPGRYAGGQLWVEAPSEEGMASADRDGVSPIIIGSNDFAAAWATDDAGRPLAAVIPGGARQREISNRFGVNLVMYVLTGNYKADQVHVPALLERLGQ